MRHAPHAAILAIVLAVLAFCGAGCKNASRGSLFHQKLFNDFDESLKDGYLTTGPADDLMGDVSTPLGRASSSREKRNEFAYALMSIVDHEYLQYEVKLSRTVRGTNLALELTSLGLTSAATITGGEQAKTVLAGIATLVTGARIAIDKELFYDTQLPVLVGRMRALRAEVKADIVEKLGLDLADYPVAAVLTDIYAYYAAGTIAAASADIAEESAKLQERATTRTSEAQRNTN